MIDSPRYHFFNQKTVPTKGQKVTNKFGREFIEDIQKVFGFV